MFSGSKWLLLMIVWSAIGFGAAFAGLAPIGGSDPRYFLRPFWYGFRAILGDFDIEYTYELLGDTYTPSQGLMGGMLITVQYFYSAFTTIYIVNLLIAKMTTQYESVKDKSTNYRKFRRVGVILEFKDMRSLFPPPLNLLEHLFKGPIKWSVSFIYKIASWLHLCGLTSERTGGPERGFSQNCTTSVIELMKNVEKNALEQYRRDLRVKGAASQAPNRIQELQEAQARLADRIRIDHEHTTNRFDRIESSVNQIADLVKALSDNLRSSAVPSATPSTPMGLGPSMPAGSGSSEGPSEETPELTAEITPELTAETSLRGTTANAPCDHSPPTRAIAATSHPGARSARRSSSRPPSEAAACECSAGRSSGVRRLAGLEAPTMARTTPRTPHTTSDGDRTRSDEIGRDRNHRTTSDGGAAADEGAISQGPGTHAISQGPGTQQKLGPAVLGTVIRI
jgi:hypothetical protein